MNNMAESPHNTAKTTTLPPPLLRFTPSVKGLFVLLNLLSLALFFSVLIFVFIYENKSLHEEVIRQISSSLDEKEKTYAAAIMHCLSENASMAIISYDFNFLNDLLEHIAVDNRAEYIMVMDFNRKVFAHSNFMEVGRVLNSQLDHRLVDIVRQKFPTEDTKHAVLELEYTKFIDFNSPGSETVQREAFHPIYVADRIWGVLRYRFNLDPMAADIQTAKRIWFSKIKALRTKILAMAAVLFLVGNILSLFFFRYFARALAELNKGVQSITAGNFNITIPLRLVSFREFTELADSFNKMSGELDHSYRQLDEYRRNLEQKVRERTEELKEAQDTMVQQAHGAGMAEMAVGILHNIGNAITPAKISNLLLLKRLRTNSLSDDVRSAMTEIAGALKAPETIDVDENQRLIAIAELLPQTVQDETEYCAKVIEGVSQKHEHIESIIGMQLRYARQNSGIEEVDINALVNDALQMLKESIENRKIIVKRHLGNIPPASIEKGKMMQIVINLIKNAYEAMDDMTQQIRILSVRTSVDQDNVVITVNDTGEGFSADQKQKLFSFGYTTKKLGSGFGLHSCANYLIANQGKIEAFSAGKGRGSSFMVKVPTRQHYTARSRARQ